jgi:hypothetical protein
VSAHLSPDDDEESSLPTRRPLGADGMVTAALVAGVVRAGLGACAFVGASLFLPIQFVTPILSGISLLMMVTGCTSLMRVTRDDPRTKPVLHGMAIACALTLIITMLLVFVLGAGHFAPELGRPASNDTVRFRAN